MKRGGKVIRTSDGKILVENIKVLENNSNTENIHPFKSEDTFKRKRAHTLAPPDTNNEQNSFTPLLDHHQLQKMKSSTPFRKNNESQPNRANNNAPFFASPNNKMPEDNPFVSEFNRNFQHSNSNSNRNSSFEVNNSHHQLHQNKRNTTTKRSIQPPNNFWGPK